MYYDNMNVDDTVKAIKDMEIRGAGRIARACAACIGDVEDRGNGKVSTI